MLNPWAGGETAPMDGEAMWLDRLAEGDLSAFWPLWQRYYADFYDQCLYWMNNQPEDAEDILSRAAIKAHDGLAVQQQPIVHLKAWLTRLIYHLCVDTHRRRLRRRQHIDSLDTLPRSRVEALADHWDEMPSEVVARHELVDFIRVVVDDLPPRLREPIVLRCVEELPYRDIAQRLTLSPANARKQVQQARAILRERLNDYLLDQASP